MENRFKIEAVPLPEYLLQARRESDTAARSASKPGGTGLHDLPSVWTLEADIEWLIDGMIPLGGITLLSAPSSTGKTWLAHAIAGAVAHGTPFLDRKVKQRPVVYLDRENPLAVVKLRLKNLGISETEKMRLWGGWNLAEVCGPDDAELIEYANKHHPLLVFDSLVRFHSGDEQSAKDTSVFMKPLRKLANLGATVIILHHTGKSLTSKKYRGSSDIEAAVDMAYFIEGKPHDRKIHRLEMENFKSRFAEGQDFGMEFEQGKGFHVIERASKATKADAAEIIERILTNHPGINGTELVVLARELDVSKGDVEKIRQEFPFVPGKGRTRHYYSKASGVPNATV